MLANDCKYTPAREQVQQSTVAENWQRVSAAAAKKKMELAWSHIEKKG